MTYMGAWRNMKGLKLSKGIKWVLSRGEFISKQLHGTTLEGVNSIARMVHD